MKIIYLLVGCALLFLISSCEPCPEKPNVSVPNTFSPANYGGTMYIDIGVSGKVNSVYLNNGWFYCTSGYVSNFMIWTGNGTFTNEFYMVKREFPTSGTEYFIWTPDYAIINAIYNCYSGAYTSNQLNPPPSFQLSPGDTVMVFKVITNTGNVNFEPGASRSRIAVRIENGQVVETFEEEDDTPFIPANSYVTLATKAIYDGTGIYEITYEVDVNNQVDEDDEKDNYAKDKSQDFINGID